jgi:hypothetical protein
MNEPGGLPLSRNAGEMGPAEQAGAKGGSLTATPSAPFGAA